MAHLKMRLSVLLAVAVLVACLLVAANCVAPIPRLSPVTVVEIPGGAWVAPNGTRYDVPPGLFVPNGAPADAIRLFNAYGR